ncbi:E3 ubiquitin-protein ligase sina-like [Melitaea cinxia]|uniref:E3 ubiquitin-protein ligase sina-like n=1 Tax=Melitaea cinxia TaxID=113334 RepID=UPI001E2702EC|nr:E3 ubiquitin-protein ligase sina-like [Melitaea cinxia]
MDLEKFFDWSKRCGLSINPSKSEVIVIGSPVIPAVLESSSREANDASNASTASAAFDAPDIRDSHDATHSDREMSPPSPSLSPVNNGDNEQTRENMEELAANTGDTSSGDNNLEDEVVDVVGTDNHDCNANTEAAEQAGGDDEPNEDMTVQIAESAEVLPVQGQGVKRKRESSKDKEPDSVKGFNQSLLRLLECPVCLEWMEPPMSQCRRGHLVCGRCRARLSACPVCRTAFSSVRNRAMEAVAEMLHYPCRHGCGRETRLRRRAAHEASCAARHYHCPAPACADRPPLALADLPQHFQVPTPDLYTCTLVQTLFQTKHLPLLKVGRKHKFSMKVNSEQHDNWLVMVARELFHLRVDVDIRTWGVVVYVAYIGPKCNASNYTYEVTVTGQHNDRKLVYTRATHSDLESSSLNVSRQDCFHLTLDQALNFLRFKNRFCEPDKFLDFVVEINKREVPVEPAVESDS